MDSTNNNTSNRKHKHLILSERMKIELRLKDGFTAYKIAKELGRPINTVINEIKRGTTDQIVNRKKISIYLADHGQASYEKARENSKPSYKRLACTEFIDYVLDKVKNKNWSLDSCVGNAITTGKFNKDEVLCTKTLYNYLHLGLLPFTVMDFPLIVKRSTMSKRSKMNKKSLGTSIEERADHIENREEFGHWEIDTVIGKKIKDEVIMSIVERKTRHAIFVKIPGKTANDVNSALLKLRAHYGLDFNKIFKTITADNGLEFAGLTELGNKIKVPVYFAHPYSSFERGTNERHNGLLRRFLPKGKAISDYDAYAIQAIEEWMNTLPRKILGYRTPEDMFEEHLDEIYKQAA